MSLEIMAQLPPLMESIIGILIKLLREPLLTLAALKRESNHSMFFRLILALCTFRRVVRGFVLLELVLI